MLHVKEFLYMTIILLTAVGCSAPQISPSVRVGTLNIDGDLDFKAGAGVQLTTSTTADDLGLDYDTVVHPRVDLDWEKLHLSAEGFQLDYDGDGVLNNSLSWKGHTIAAQSPVASQWELGFYRAHLTYDLISSEFLNLGIGGGAGMIYYDLEISSKATSARASADSNMPFGFLTLRAATEIADFDAQALISGLGVSLENEEISYFDAEMNIGYRLFAAESLEGRLKVGYRFINVQYEFEDAGRDVELDVDFTGPFIEFCVTF